MATNFDELKARYEGVDRDGLLRELEEMQVKGEDQAAMEAQIEKVTRSATLLERHLEEKDQQLLIERRRREMAEEAQRTHESVFAKVTTTLRIMVMNCPHCAGSGFRSGDPAQRLRCGYCFEARALLGLDNSGDTQ